MFLLSNLIRLPFPSGDLSEQFSGSDVLGKGCKIIQWQKGSSQSPSTSSGQRNSKELGDEASVGGEPLKGEFYLSI